MDTQDHRRQPKAALFAVALFLFFDSLALGLNFWLTWRIESQAIGINLAGRQRMLSQRMVKVLLQLDNALSRQESVDKPLKELQLTFTLFDNTLQGFHQGHHTQGGADDTLFLPAVESREARVVVDEAVALWQPYRQLVTDLLLAAPADLKAKLVPTVAYGEQHNLTLLKLMNQLTTELERQTQREASQIRYYQGAAFTLALLNFFGAFVLYARRMRQAGVQRDLLDEIINKIAASVMVMDPHARIVKANRTAEQLFGYSPGQLNGRFLKELLRGNEGNLIGQRKDGTTFLAASERNEVSLEGRTLLIETIVDITQQRMTEQHLSSLAYHDLLTKLPNRLLFEDRLQVELAHAQRRHQKLGVMFLDLDRFKPVNDQYGHEIGDQLLKEVAARLQQNLRDSDTVARRGGDEFTLLINDAGSHEAIANVALNIIKALTTPFELGSLTLHIGGSIGISVFPEHGNDADTLLRLADEAMYQAKESGRGTYRFYGETDLPAA